MNKVDGFIGPKAGLKGHGLDKIPSRRLQTPALRLKERFGLFLKTKNFNVGFWEAI